MKNWDPLSVFKYLTGAPSMHVVMLINYYLTEPLVLSDSNSYNFEAKADLITRMRHAHQIAALSFFILESGLLGCCLDMGHSIIVPSVSLFIQIVCYQGLVFEELNFFFYKELPFMTFTEGKGLFGEFERWDVLIMLDIILFLSNLVSIVIFCVGSVYEGQYLKSIFEKKENQEEKDYLEDGMDVKKVILQINSLAIANSVYLYLIYIDDFQRDMKIQWFVLFCDWFFLLAI